MKIRLTSWRILAALGVLSAALLTLQAYAGMRIWEVLRGVVEKACGCTSFASSTLWWQQPTMLVFLVIALLGGSGLMYALGTALMAWLRTQHIARYVQQSLVAPPEGLGIHEKVDVVKYVPGGAFTYGFWKPRIVVGMNALLKLTLAERSAIMRHEEQHLVRRDPLRLMVVTALQRLWFWMPLVYVLGEWYKTSIEMVADHNIVPTALAGALYKLHGGTPLSHGAGIAPFGACLQTRVARITHPHVPWGVCLPWHAIVASVGLASVMGGFLVGPAPQSDGVVYTQCHAHVQQPMCHKTLPTYGV